MNRRDLLKGAAVASVAAAVPVVALAKSAPDRTAWDEAFAKWQRVDAEYDRLCTAADAADEAWGEAVPRIDRYFDTYGLDMLMSRDMVLGRLQLFNTRSRLAGKPQIDKEAVADEFDAYRERSKRAHKLFRCDELDEQRKAYLPTFQRARDEFMRVPAPDNAALLVKIEIATTSLDDEHGESVLADARRLLSHGRA